MKIQKLAIFVILVCLSSFASAKEVAGLNISDTTIVDGDELILNGAGVRSKFFFKIYIGALYLKQKANSSESVYSMDGPKQITMSILYDEIEAEKLIAAWNDGFNGNNTPDELESLKDRITQFNALFKTVHKGDTIRLDMIPGTGVDVWFNGEPQASIAGDDFIEALLKIWLGEKPADDDLKEGMLGG